MVSRAIILFLHDHGCFITYYAKRYKPHKGGEGMQLGLSEMRFVYVENIDCCIYTSLDFSL